MARKRSEAVGADPKLIAKFREQAKKKGGRVIEQLPIHAWGDQEIGFVLSGDFLAIREGKAKAGSEMKAGHLLDIVNHENGEVETWGCPAVLKSRLEQNLVSKGDSLEILLSGQLEAKPGRNAAWDFVVAHYVKGE